MRKTAPHRNFQTWQLRKQTLSPENRRAWALGSTVLAEYAHGEQFKM